MDALLSHQLGLTHAVALALLHSLWQITLLAALAALAMAIAERRSAGLRHAIGMGFLLAMLLVPAASFMAFLFEPASEVNAGLWPAMSAPTMAAAPGIVPGQLVQESGPFAGWLTLLWMAGALLMLLRHFGGWRLVGVLERQPFELLPSDWQQRVLALQSALGITRTVLVRLGEDIASPFTARLLRPLIWLPLSLITRLPIEQVEALIAHELAHIRRLDWLWNGMQCLVESLLFFHPGVWWLGRRIRQEREHACDDLAVLACGNAIALAEALAGLERDRQSFPRLVLQAQGGSLMKRITRLLAAPSGAMRWRLPAAIALVLGTGIVLASQSEMVPSVQIHSSTSQTALQPGDTRTITSTGPDGKREYTVVVGKDGDLTETYKVDGKIVSINKRGRDWIDDVSRLSVPPAPPPPPPAPPPPAPPAPPASPPPPLLSENPDFKQILRLVSADRALTARVGNPVTVDVESVDGNIQRGDGTRNEGSANLRIRLGGPKGRVIADVVADHEDGQWRLASVQLRGVQ